MRSLGRPGVLWVSLYSVVSLIWKRFDRRSETFLKLSHSVERRGVQVGQKLFFFEQVRR